MMETSIASFHVDPVPLRRLSVVIPCFNEESTLGELLRRVLEAPTPGFAREVIVIDDGSTDRTSAILDDFAGTPGLTIVHQDNRGKGAALRAGFERARGQWLLIQDADLEYDPADYPCLLQPILDGTADVVFGSRFLARARRPRTWWHFYGNRALTTLSNLTTGFALTDVHTCYKVFRRELLPQLALRSRGFEIDPELTAAFAETGCRVVEVPISYAPRTPAQGKKIRLRDGLSALVAIARHAPRARRRRVLCSGPEVGSPLPVH
jgi:glycosyltransferase involved in cell wall biosynthesis